MRTLMEMHEKGEGIDLLTIMSRLTEEQREQIGGIVYLSDLMGCVPSAANLEYYLKTVFDKYIQRQFIRVCSDAVTRIFENESDDQVSTILDSVESAILKVNEERVISKDMDWRAVIKRVVLQLEDYHRGHGQMRGIPTGFDYLDKMVCGLAPGQMIVLAGRPGTGKTSLGFNIVEHVTCELKKPVGVFSLEMTGEELGSRSVFQRAKADFQRFRTGFLCNEDVPKLAKATADMAAAKIFLDDTPGLTIMDIRAKARRWHSQHGIEMLLVDYLQLVQGSGRYRERKDDVAEISAGMKSMAKELGIPVVVLAQLNRESEKEKRLPRLSDLGDSGAIERDADMVGILWEPKLKDDEQKIMDSKTDWAAYAKRINLHICKQRNGPTGPVEFLFRKSSMRFEPFIRTRKQTEEEPETEM
jgi:replicative DNA helicase